MLRLALSSDVKAINCAMKIMCVCVGGGGLMYMEHHGVNLVLLCQRLSLSAMWLSFFHMSLSEGYVLLGV